MRSCDSVKLHLANRASRVALIPQTRHRHLPGAMVENGVYDSIKCQQHLMVNWLIWCLRYGIESAYRFKMTRVIILASDRDFYSTCFDLANTCFHQHSRAEQQANAQTSTAKASDSKSMVRVVIRSSLPKCADAN